MFKKGNIPWNKGEDNEVKCSYCGKTKLVYLCIFKRNKNFYCNIICRTKYWIGKNNPMFGKKQSNKCKKIVSENGKKLIGENNPMFNKKIDRTGKNYYYNDVGHVCRSSWEINYARILKFNNEDYVYEKTTFKLNKGDSYTPDFYIKNTNEYIEIKGYFTEKFNKKFNRFIKEYPKINIKIIGKIKYDLLKKEYEKKIEWEYGGRIKQNFKFNEEEIKEIKISKYKVKEVYNLSIEDDESFIVNGLVVHNTRPHVIKPVSAKALHWKSGGKDFFAKSVNHPGTNPQPYFRPARNMAIFRIKNFLK